ncbi:MAG TPA: alpha/beta hydrolase [Jatrophihabitans sp.]|jgi:pimeloyl-ACP methyl ester carboxylesterase|uniref:alpha/beta fold hydrolase n=1 Tax=Jatrophihabitans sp. TaxID=1932789 RepID=UPI002F216AB3
MRLARVAALVGGGVGVLTAVSAAAVSQQRRTAARERSRIEAGSAALLSQPPISDEGLVLTDDGIELHYEECGGPAGGKKAAGLTVLFVHGYTLNLGSFLFQRRALTEAFGTGVRQVFYDQRSHGRSGRAPSQSCTIEQLGHDLHSVIDQLAPAGPIVLVGHSMGGMTVMALADQHPELFRDGGRVRSVVLINTSSGELKNLTLGLPNVLARLHAPMVPIVLRRAAKNAALVEQARTMGRDLAWVMTKRLSFAAKDVDPAVVQYCTTMISATPVDVVADFYPTLMAYDGRMGLRNLKDCPVLVIGADSDAMTPLEHSKAIARELPEARLIVAENSGHLLMLEHPELVNSPLVAVVEAALTGRPGMSGTGQPVSA